MQKFSIFTATVGTFFSAALVAESPLQAKTLDITLPDSSNPQFTPDQPIKPPNIPNNHRYIAPPEQIPPSPITIAQTFQPETNNTAPIWNNLPTQQPTSNWQVETQPTNQVPQWATETTLPDTNLAQIPESNNPDSFASDPPSTTEQLTILKNQLEAYEEVSTSIVKPYRASPGITLSIPSGFGADRGKTFVGVGLQRTRVNTYDGGAGIGIGLGNADKGVGVQVSYTSSSISPGKLFSSLKGIAASDRPFGAGGFNLKIHKQFPDGLSVALGADSIVSIGPKTGGINANDGFGQIQNEFQGTYYGVATKFFKLKPDANEPFSRLAVTVGAGTGRFQITQSQIDQRKVITPFASVALKISRNTSAIAEWSGQDFGIALSWVPFRNLPIVLTPAIRDLFGPDAEKPRFVMGFGLGF